MFLPLWCGSISSDSSLNHGAHFLCVWLDLWNLILGGAYVTLDAFPPHITAHTLHVWLTGTAGAAIANLDLGSLYLCE